jgi:hypothetical protein
LVSLFLVAACSLAGRGAPGGAVMITPESNGRTIELRSDQELLVRLPGNPAMGYRWSLAAAHWRRSLKLEGCRRSSAIQAAGRSSRSGDSTAHTGRQSDLHYCLPWETGRRPRASSRSPSSFASPG